MHAELAAVPSSLYNVTPANRVIASVRRLPVEGSMAKERLPGMLLWVEDIAFDEKRKSHVLYGCDLRGAFEWPSADVSDKLYILRPLERSVFTGVDVSYAHRINRGWEWETTTPDLFPEPPYLLTDDEDCKCVLDCEVAIYPTEVTNELIQGDLYWYGYSLEPLIGEGWFGVIRVESHDATKAHITAFARSELTNPNLLNVNHGEAFKEPFGRIVPL